MLLTRRARINAVCRPQVARAFSSEKDKELAMPTPRSLGFDLTYQECPNLPPGQQRKIAVICGWMGAKPRQLKVYEQFYHSHHFDTLSYAAGPQHVLRPQTATQLMTKVITEINTNRSAAGSAGAGAGSGIEKVVFHQFSMGGFLFGQMLRVLKDGDKEMSREFLGKVKAQVFDSPPDFSGIAKGVSQSMGVGPPFSHIIHGLMLTYLAVTKNTAGVEHRAASAAFHNNYITAPSLWFYSKADPVADYRDCEKVCDSWRGLGTDVQQVVW
mmetsp:Transcript_12603/g.27983  ORF Transcript_12603/g.27983 Transcript_12603/m.27983 type:complete len:270 (-) Transcript_12603:25-834(-)